MEHTSIELLKYVNDIKIEHEQIKKEILLLTDEVGDIENKINDRLNRLDELENNYVILLEMLNEKENNPTK